SASCCRAFRLCLPAGGNGNLPALCFRLRHRNVYLQHAIPEVGLRLFDLGAFRQRNEPIKTPVHTLGDVVTTLFAGLFLLALAFNHQAVFGGFHLHIILRQAWQVRVNEEVISRLAHFYCRRPVELLLEAATLPATSKPRKRAVDVFSEPSHQGNRTHGEKFSRADRKNRWQIAARTQASERSAGEPLSSFLLGQVGFLLRSLSSRSDISHGCTSKTVCNFSSP